MRVLVNELRLKRGRQIGTAMFFFSLVILIAGLIFTNFIAVSSEALFFVPCLVMPLGLISTIISVRLTNQYVRQPRPETALREGLEGINRRSILFHYFPPASHILVTPHGVYTLTTRFQTTRFKVEGDKWTNYRARGPLAPFFLFMKQEGLGEPFVDAEKEAANVQELVDEVLPTSGITVQPVVIFVSARAVVEINDPKYPVAYASPKKKPSIKAVLRDDKKEKQREDFEALSDDQITLIRDALVLTLTEREQAAATEEEGD